VTVLSDLFERDRGRLALALSVGQAALRLGVTAVVVGVLVVRRAGKLLAEAPKRPDTDDP
jgi:hypothetical protein